MRPEDYGLFVTNPSIPVEDVRAWAGEGATLLGYVNARFAGRWGADEGVHGRLRAVVEAADGFEGPVYRDLGLGYRFTDANASAIAGWAERELSGFDGVYLDDCFSGGLPAGPLSEAAEASGETLDEVARDWLAFRDVLVREIAGRGIPVVANLGGGDPALVRNLPLRGITMENWWPERRAEFDAEVDGRYDGRWCVSWRWTSERAREGRVLE
jgi:hypothetical protein